MKLKYKVLLFTIISLNISIAQIGFSDHIIVDESYEVDGAVFVVNADLDNDGDIDVVSGSSEDGSVAYYENVDGVGTFKTYIITNNLNGLNSIHVADIDGNGYIDIIGSARPISGADSVFLIKNNGTNTFESPEILLSGSDYPIDVIASDLDGDNDMDIAIAYAAADKVSWIENVDGQGNFGSIQDITLLTDNVSEIAATDIDGDSDMDIVSASINDDTLAWYENVDGQGNFGTQQIIDTPDTVDRLDIGDIDGDGDMDVVASSIVDKEITWYENTNGLGAFGTPQTVFLDTNYPSDLNLVDIDGDGALDVVANYTFLDKIVWYRNTDGLGTFSTENTIAANIDASLNVDIADIDGDGYIDVLSASGQETQISWLKNMDGLGNFSDYIIINDYPEGPEAVYVTDLDGDGDNDILVASRSDNEIVWFKNLDGQGSFSDQIIITDDPGMPSFANQFNLITVDIDGDNDLDIFINARNKLSWYENVDGSASTFTEHIIDDTTNGGSSISVKDIDGDTFLDLVVSRTANSRFETVWYKNNGQAVFSLQNTLSITQGFDSGISAVVDIDNDGDSDVLVLHESNSELILHKNTDGQGNFTASTISDVNGGTYTAFTANDLDGDGDIDVLISRGPSIFWIENLDGQGTFGTPNVITTASASSADMIFAIDIDIDGDLDILMSRSGINNRVAWYENVDGQGNFGTVQIISTYSNNPRALHYGDIDSDGDLDAVSASWSNSAIIWHENMGVAYNEIMGHVRQNFTGSTCDISNPPFSNVMVIATSGTETLASFTSNTGFYQLFTNEGNFTTSIASQLPNYYQSNPNTHTSNFVGIDNIDTADFCIEPIGAVNDLNIIVYPSIDEPRPGFDTTYRIVYNNIGTTMLSGTVSLEFDDTKVQFLNASETVTSQTSNTVTFDFTDLNPFENRFIDLNFNVFPPPTTNIDEILLTKVTITPLSGDVTPDDNEFTLEQIVIGSYDPNDIQVLEGEQISINDVDKYLHYIIRFQNTGTASAINVRVDNVLDDKLDWTTMQLQSLSHPGRVEIANGNMVQFVFDNINLPDSTNDEPNSHGFITYKIKPKSNVVIGDIINNKADIFFDFNPPIITNTVSTEIVDPLSVNEFNTPKMIVYPNPTNGEITINTNNKLLQKLALYDLSGRLLKTAYYTTISSEIKFDLKAFSEGIYFLKIETESGIQTQKIIKN